MQNKKNDNSIKLNNWLFKKPILFGILFFISSIVLIMAYTLFQMIFNIETSQPIIALFLLTFAVCTWYTIKKLPHDKMAQNDFIAITNGSTLISVITTFILMIIVGLYGDALGPKLLLYYLAHKTLVIVLLVLFGLFSLYLLGLAICNIYAKYKRATSIGITPWKVILSMPFAFLLMWTPGYLLKGKDIKNNLQIKCQWYARLQKWVVSNNSNILFTFIFLLLCRGIITGLATFILYASLLIIYALWYAKHKSDFLKNVNDGYAMTAVGINIAIVIAVIIGFLGK